MSSPGTVEGLDALMSGLKQLPAAMRQRLLSAWATSQGKAMAVALRPHVRQEAFKTGRTLGSITGARVRPAKALALFQADGRAITYSSRKRGGGKWHWIVRGTKRRQTKKGANRGHMPPDPIIGNAASSIAGQVMPAALADLKARLDRALARAAKGSAP